MSCLCLTRISESGIIDTKYSIAGDKMILVSIESFIELYTPFVS